jgi:hypothetical protein
MACRSRQDTAIPGRLGPELKNLAYTSHPIDDRRGVRLLMRIDTDHELDVVCQHDHGDSFPGEPAVGAGLEGTVWQDCDESHHHAVDRLLIRPTHGDQAGAGDDQRTIQFQGIPKESPSPDESHPPSPTTILPINHHKPATPILAVPRADGTTWRA